MGFLQLLSCAKLTACHIPGSPLLLEAAGTCPEHTSAVSFLRDSEHLSGLRFKLVARLGLLPGSEEDFVHRQAFAVGAHPEEVLIEDARGLHVVPVRTLPPQPAPLTDEQQAPVTETFVHHLRVRVGEPFEVSGAATLPPGGSLHLAHDESYLLLHQAALRHSAGSGPELIWTLHPQRPGTTTIHLTCAGGRERFVSLRTLQVSIDEA